MSLTMMVARSPREAFAASDCLSYVDPATLGDGLAPGDVVQLRTPRGRATLARLAAGQDVAPGALQLDRYLRQALKTRLGDSVTVERVEAPPLRQVTLLPAVDVWGAHHLEEHLRESFAQVGTPVALGSVLYCQFHDSIAGTTYKVIDVKDGPGVVTPDTDVRLEYSPAHTTDAG